MSAVPLPNPSPEHRGALGRGWHGTFQVAADTDGQRAVVEQDIPGAHRGASVDVAEEADAMGQANRECSFAQAALRRHQLAIDRVSSLSVESFPGLERALGNGGDVPAPFVRHTGWFMA